MIINSCRFKDQLDLDGMNKDKILFGGLGGVITGILEVVGEYNQGLNQGYEWTRTSRKF